MEPKDSLPYSQVHANCSHPRQLDPIHTPTFYFLNICLNITLPSTPWSVGRCQHGTEHPQIGDGGMASSMEGTWDIYSIRSGGQPTICCPPAWGLGEMRTIPHLINIILLRNTDTLSHIIYIKISACQPNPEQLNPANTPTISFHKAHFNNTLSSLSHYCNGTMV